MYSKSGRIIGIIFVIIGAIFLLDNLNIIDPVFEALNFWRLVGLFWPSLFLLLPAFFFHFGFFKGRGRDPGLLVPGGILLILGIAFQINMLFGGWEITWPFYIFSVAFGLFELYYFGNREKGLLIPIFILGGLSFVFFAAFSMKELLGFDTGRAAIPIVLIVIGVLIMFGGRGKKEF